jgi:valine dehydrogenase (NAD+)
MHLFDSLDGHEQVVVGNDPASGLRCLVAIHSTVLGPALGGTRFHAYPDEDAALADVLRLSRAMTYKAACAGMDLGGGKAVIIGDPTKLRSEALLRAYGRIVASLGGRYVTAGDIGTTPEDLAVVRRETRHVTGLPSVEGGSGDSGVPTALGVFLGLRATVRRALGTDDLAGIHVVVQGLGKVGRRLVGHLLDHGAHVTVADVDERAVALVAEHDRVAVVAPHEVLDVEADVLSPNALGGVITEDNAAGLRVRAVVGGANNQLATPAAGAALHAAGITYAPDYVVNSGGIISVGDELEPGGYDPERVAARTQRIADTLVEVFAEADAAGVRPEVAAGTVAERRIEAVARLGRFRLPG